MSGQILKAVKTQRAQEAAAVCSTLEKEYLEIALCAQHNNGGIAVDLWWQTSVKGLFAAGEILDVDGDCGGFNLSWAWSSGTLAAESAVDYL